MLKTLRFCLMFIATISSVYVVEGARAVGETYHTKVETIERYTSLCNNNSDQCSYEVIGQTLLGKDIMMFKFGNPEGGIVMMDGEGHGPEDCGTEISYKFAEWMITSDEEDAVRARNNNYFMVIPVLNGDSYRRQNARRNYTLANGSILLVPDGVDLNRNAPIGWGGSGSGNASHPYEYRGISPASEPETQAIVYAMQKYDPAVYVNTHCGMYLRNYYPMNNVTKKIIDVTNELAVEHKVNINSSYPAHAGCSGGHICRTGGTYGTSGWIVETAPWDALPENVTAYYDKFYPKMFVIWRGMLQAVEKEKTLPHFTFDCDYRGSFWHIGANVFCKNVLVTNTNIFIEKGSYLFAGENQ